METNRCDIDETRKYLQGKMTEEEASAFELNLATDPQFRGEFDFNKDLLESMRMHYKSHLKEKLQDLDNASATQSKSRRRYLTFTGVAASVALIAAITFGLLYDRSNPQAIFNEYYTPYYNVLDGTERSVGGENSDLAMRLYDQERYKEALTVFDEAIKDNPDSEALIFYRALSYMSLGQTDEAIRPLIRMSNNAGSQFREPAQWYLGLAYLQIENIDKAREVFKAIKGIHGNSYADRAGEILEMLD